MSKNAPFSDCVSTRVHSNAGNNYIKRLKLKTTIGSEVSSGTKGSKRGVRVRRGKKKINKRKRIKIKGWIWKQLQRINVGASMGPCRAHCGRSVPPPSSSCWVQRCAATKLQGFYERGGGLRRTSRWTGGAAAAAQLTRAGWKERTGQTWTV